MQNHEFTFKEYFIALLRRADLLLLFALVFAILLGALSYGNFVRNKEGIQAAYQKQLERYEDELNTRLSQSEYHRGVAAAAEKYNANSLLMQIDPYNKQVATLNLSVSVEPAMGAQSALGSSGDYVGLRDYLVQNIISRYLILANRAKLGDVLKDVLPGSYDEAFLREMVKIERYSEAGLNTAEKKTDQGILSVTAFGTADISAERIVDAIKAYLESRKPLVDTAVQAHDLVVLDESSYTTVDNDLVKFQAEQRNLVSESNQKAINFLKEADGLRGNRPKETSLVPGVVKNALVGAVLGGAFGILVVALMSRLRAPVQYVQQLQELTGMGFLGAIRSKRKSLLSALIRRLSGEKMLSDDPEAKRIIAANVDAASHGLHKVLLTGSVPEAELKALAESIAADMQAGQVELLYGSNINRFSETVRKLSEADGVVLVESLQRSQLEEVYRQKQRLEMSGKPILGYVLC